MWKNCKNSTFIGLKGSPVIGESSDHTLVDLTDSAIDRRIGDVLGFDSWRYF